MFTKQSPDPALVADGELAWKRFAKVLDDHLATREYVAGKLSIADLAISTITMYRGPAQIDVTPFAQYLARIEARESWKQTQPQM
jgi:glutathione S-transferase